MRPSDPDAGPLETPKQPRRLREATSMVTGIPIDLDRSRSVKIDYGALRQIQTMLGKPIGRVFRDMQELSLEDIEIVLWQGLRHEDRQLKRDDMARLLGKFFESGKDIGDVLSVLNDALMQSGFFGRGEGRESQQNGG
jgi:hypothetical protein